MKVGDIVFELPLGKLWYHANPWFKGDEIGIVTEVVDHNNVIVLWPTGHLVEMEMQHLEACNESR